jgi:hypothetical protein
MVSLGGIVATFSLVLAACGGNVNLGDTGASLKKGDKCTSCTGGAAKDAKLCGDGTTLGRECLANGDGTCGYDFPACPGSCEDACGPTATIAKQCADGTAVGYKCTRNYATNTCAATIKCPEEACTDSECPKNPYGVPNRVCDDGKTVGGPACKRDKTGVCGWTLVACPAACATGECGPAIGAPLKLCPDGVHYEGIGDKCLRDAVTNVCAWEKLTCPK